MSKHSDEIIQNTDDLKSNIVLKDNIQNNNNDDNINVDIDSEVVRNSELDPEARSYKPIKNENLQPDEGVKSDFNQDFLESAVQFELDYHFSDVSLSMDNYLLSRMHENKDYWVSFDTVANLTKVKGYTTDENIIRNAIRRSELLIFNEDETKVKRPNFKPPKPKQHKDLRRTIFLYGLRWDISKEEIHIICKKYGVVKKILLDNPNETKIKVFKENEECIKHTPKKLGTDRRGSEMFETMAPDREVSEIVMKKKFGSRYVPLNNNIVSNFNNINENNIPLVPSLHVDTSGNPINSIPITPNVGITQPFIHPNQNPNGDPNDFSHLRSCFVVFESQGQATKCVKDRLKSQDGIRAMHQYDFNKAKKKVAAAKARGLSPMFSPLVTTIPTNLSSGPNQSFNFNNAFALGPSYMSNNTKINYSNNNNNYRHSNNSHYNNNNDNRRSYNNNNRHPQSARHYNRGNNRNNDNNNNNNNRRNTYSHGRIAHSTRNHRNSTNTYHHKNNKNNNNNNNRNNNRDMPNFNRRTSDNSRWGFTNDRGNKNNRNRSSPRITPKKPFISPSYSNFEGITAKAPENHKGFGWKRNSNKYKPPKPTPNQNYNYTFGTNENNKNSKYYKYDKQSPTTPNNVTATIVEFSGKRRPKTTTSVRDH